MIFSKLFSSLFLWVIYQQSYERLVFHFRHAENSSPNFFSSEKNPENPEITPRCHQPSTPSPPNYKPVGTLAGSSTPSSTEEPPHTKPSYSGPKPPHCSFPPMALQATDHQLQTEYSFIRLSSFQTPAQNLIKPKKQQILF